MTKIGATIVSAAETEGVLSLVEMIAVLLKTFYCSDKIQKDSYKGQEVCLFKSTSTSITLQQAQTNIYEGQLP